MVKIPLAWHKRTSLRISESTCSTSILLTAWKVLRNFGALFFLVKNNPREHSLFSLTLFFPFVPPSEIVSEAYRYCTVKVFFFFPFLDTGSSSCVMGFVFQSFPFIRHVLLSPPDSHCSTAFYFFPLLLLSFFSFFLMPATPSGEVQTRSSFPGEMSGAGRKHRAKHLTRQFLEAEWTGPQVGERLGLCMAPPQGQQVQVYVLPALHEDGSTTVAEECRVSLPRKFHKVIWLAVRDVVVVANDGLSLKPSPEQLKQFLKTPLGAAYQPAIEDGRRYVEANRREVEVRPMMFATTTSLLQEAPTAAPEGQREGEREEEEADDNWMTMGNPNRRTIKHRQQFFYEEGERDEEEESEDD